MLDVVIKNSILLGLVIMVAHFMIKNELEDKITRRIIQEPTRSGFMRQSSNTHDELAQFFLEATKARSGTNSPVSSQQTTSMLSEIAPFANPDDADSVQLKDLYDYVYKNTDESSAELAALYKETLRSDCIQGTKKTVKCDLVGNNAGDKRMCKNPIDEHISKQQKAEVPLVERPENGFKFGTRVKDYQNETVMNGAYIDGTRMTGFDANDRLFAGALL